MQHLTDSFRTHLGERGCHFYDEIDCHFLNWKDVLRFLNALSTKEDIFSQKLEHTLANYDPNREFLAVQQRAETVSVELYSKP